MEFPVFDFVPIASCSLWIPMRRVWLCVLYSPSHQLFTHIAKIPLNLLLSSRSSRSFFSLSLCNRCSIPWAQWPFDGLILVCLFCTGKFRTGHNTPAGSHQWWGEAFLSWPAADVPTKVWLFWEGPLLACDHLGSHQDTLALFYQTAFQPVVTQHGAQGYSSLWPVLAFFFN